MKKNLKEKIVCYFLEYRSGQEFVEWWNQTIKNNEMDMPKISYCVSDTSGVANYSCDGYSSEHPLDIVDLDKFIDKIISLKITTSDEEVDRLLHEYYVGIYSIFEFLETIPEDTFIMLWNDYQKEINGENYLYRMNQFVDAVYKKRYILRELAKHLKGFNSEDNYFIVENGDFKSSNKIDMLIDVDDLINYYDNQKD